MAAGRAAKGLGILVRTGYGGEEEKKVEALGTVPDHVAEGLEDAADWILTHRTARPQE